MCSDYRRSIVCQRHLNARNLNNEIINSCFMKKIVMHVLLSYYIIEYKNNKK